MSIKMKRIILFALILLLTSGQAWSQWRHSKATSPYRPMATFNGDTAAYLEFNYSIRNVQYIGKTVGEILKEVEFPVLFITAVVVISSVENKPTPVKRIGLGIRQIGKEPNPYHDYYISVFFENPPTLSEYRKAAGATKAFTPHLYDFIKNLKVSDVSVNDAIIRDPEIWENRRRIHEENERKGREGREMWERRQREELERQRRNQQ